MYGHFKGISYDFPYNSIQMYTVFGWIIEGPPDELRENFRTILLNEIWDFTNPEVSRELFEVLGHFGGKTHQLYYLHLLGDNITLVHLYLY